MGLFKRHKKVIEPELPQEPIENQAEAFEFRKHKEYRDKEYMLLGQWSARTGDIVKAGQELNSLTIFGGPLKNYSIKTKYDGVIEFHKELETVSNYINDGERIFTIYRNPTQEKIDELRLITLYNIPIVEKDDFLGTQEIRWEIVGGRDDYLANCDCVMIWGDGGSLFFTLNNLENKDYIIFRYSQKDFKLTVGSKISFLFEDDTIHKFTITQKPYKHQDGGYETKLPISIYEIETFRNKTFLKFQVEFTDGGKIRGDVESDQQFITKTFSSKYKELVEQHITEYEPLTERVDVEIEPSDKKNDGSCYVYLMIDTNNNYHKIGISNHPYYREKTLQSEKPTIEMLANKKFPNRKIAASFEQALHNTYADQRIRGEWFELGGDDVEDIIESLK